MNTIDVNRGISARFWESVLCAGTSALLISIPHLRPEYWFISLFALVPFLWRTVRVNLLESVVLGSTLATSYSLATLPVVQWGNPSTFLVKLIALNFVFVLYSVLVNRVSKRVGFNAVFMAVFWLPLEYALGHCIRLGSIFTLQDGGSSALLLRISSLFGVLMVSFLVVLINSLILIVSEHFARTVSSKSGLPAEADEGLYELYWKMELEGYWHYFADPRAPPVLERPRLI